MNLIAQAFETEEEYNGTLRAGTSDVATARVTVFYNRLDPKEIRVKIGDITWFNTPPRQPIPAEEVSRLDFWCKDNELTLKLDVTNSMCFTSAETSVLEYAKSTKPSDTIKPKIGSPALSSAVYLFPLTGFTISHSFSTFSDIKGYFRGYFKSDGNDEKHVEWRDESIMLETTLGVASLYDSMTRESYDSDEHYHGSVIGRRSVFAIESISGKVLFDRDEGREYARILFNMLSVLEQNSINWYKERFSILDKNNFAIQSDVTIVANHTAENARLTNSRANRYKSELTSFLPFMIDTYVELEDAKKTDVDEVIRSYRIATRAETIETSLVYLHSCLDLLKKMFDFPGMPFSRNIRQACQKARVDLEDLVFTPSTKVIDKFRFNEIRDAFLHDGFHIDSYEEVISEIRKMRALAERLLLSLMGIDYRKTRVGYPTP